MYYTFQIRVMQLLHFSRYDIYTRHAITISPCSDTHNVITTSYYISVVMTSTHVMQIQYHTIQTHVM